jgi:adenosylcobinamide-phosphate synthase
VQGSASTALLAFLLLHFITGLAPLHRIMPSPPLFAAVRAAGFWLDHRLNRRNRARRILVLRGAAIALLFLAASALLGKAIEQLPYPGVVDIVLLFLTVALMQPLHLLRILAKMMKGKKTAEAAHLLRPYARGVFDKPDSHTVARRAVEWSAASLNIWFTGPLFWFIIGGPRGVILYSVIAALAVTTAPDDPHHKFFGLAVRWINYALNFFSGALTALVIAIAALFVSRCSPARALSTAAGHGVEAWPVAAMAGALGVTLGGPPHKWIGPKDSSAKVTPEDIERCALLHFVFFLCTMALVSAGILAAHFFHISK